MARLPRLLTARGVLMNSQPRGSAQVVMADLTVRCADLTREQHSCRTLATFPRLPFGLASSADLLINSELLAPATRICREDVSMR